MRPISWSTQHLMDVPAVATRLLSKVEELAKTAQKVTTAGPKKGLPSYNRTSKVGRAGSDSDGDVSGDGGGAAAAQDGPGDKVINPDQFNKPRHFGRLDDVDEIDQEVSADQVHTGRMIALFLEPTIAQRLAANDTSAPNDERHITVAYLPDGAPPEVDSIVAVLAAQTPPFHGRITGTASFPPDGNDESAHYATVDVPGLAQFRAQLVDHLTAIGIPVSRPDTYTPHITLRYYQAGEQPPPHPLDHGGAPIPIRLAQLSIARGDDVRRFPLGRDL